jgi:TonB family protein
MRARCRSLLPIVWVIGFALLIACGLTIAQDTITVDAVAAMRVCSAKNPASAGPCANPPKPISKENPKYPEEARRARHEGTVVLGLIVEKDGSAHDVHVVKGVDDAINQAAMTAVSQWKFEPATYEGSAVAVEMTVEVNFRLEEKSAVAKGRSAGGASERIRNLFNDADEAYKRHDYETAVALTRRIIDAVPDNANAWNSLGRGLLGLGQEDAAASALEKSIRLDPASSFAYNNLGRVYWKQHKYADAEAQFRSQIVINAEDHYAHGNLGVMLQTEKKCAQAIPELDKALTITPGKADLLIARGQCELDGGEEAKGVSDLEQATSVDSAPGILNSAAYSLAERNLELDRAEKWSETSLAIESARLRNVSLEHLAPEQLNYVFWTAHYWDTRGWIYFLRGDTGKARAYIEAAWWLLPRLVVGDHLGQIYEKAGEQDRALRTYAMAAAATNIPSRENPDPDEIQDLQGRLARLAGAGADVDQLIRKGGIDLAELNKISVPNPSKSNGSADFALLFSAQDSKVEVRQVGGDVGLEKIAQALRGEQIPIRLSAEMGIPMRGTLTCKAAEEACQFAVLDSEAARALVRNGASANIETQARSAAPDPHIYDSPTMGMRVSLADEWKLIKQERGSFSRPYNALFGKDGSLAFFLLTREHIESPPDLYQKMIEGGLSQKAEYRRTGTEAVTRDGFQGSRWSMAWSEPNGVAYVSVMEIFTVGEDHYRLTALGPKEVFSRYAQSFESMFRSVQFPLLHSDPRTLEGLK